MRCGYFRHIEKTRNGYQGTVACGQCLVCKENKINDITLQLSFEARKHEHVGFLTLTYEDQHSNFGNVSKKDVQLFFRYLRRIPGFPDFKYYGISEYSPHPSYRPHYHFCIFGIPTDLVGEISDTWRKGFITYEKITPGRMHYVARTHVLLNEDIPAGLEPNFRLYSNGIGKLTALDNVINPDLTYYKTDKRTYRIPKKYKNLLNPEAKWQALEAAQQAYHEALKQPYSEENYKEWAHRRLAKLTKKNNKYGKYF